MNRSVRTFKVQRHLWAILAFAIVVAGSHAKSAEPPRAKLGVIPSDVEGRLIVKDVFVGGPAQRAGLRPGDQILTVNDKTIANSAELIELISSLDPNTRVKVGISRDGWTRTITVRLLKPDDLTRLRPSLAAPATTPSATPPGSVVRPRGTVDPEKYHQLNDPNYRAKRQRL